MKILLTALVLLITSLSFNVCAHADHSHINNEEAIKTTVKSATQMTFKDFGFEVGKLHNSWKSLTADDVVIDNVKNGHFFISANNESLKTTLYFKIAQNGQLVDVSNNSF